MIAELGLAALWLAAALSVLQLGMGIAALKILPVGDGEGDQAEPGGGATGEASSITPPPPFGWSPSP